jgi:DNA-binding transcriptional LysR family regulator
MHGGLAPKAVLDGTVDFAFSRAMHHGDHVGSVVYARDEVLIAVANDHPLAEKTSVTIDDVMDEPFITYPFVRDGMVRNLVGSMAQNSGGIFSVRYAVADTPMLLSLVAAGLGVEGIDPLDNTIIWNQSRAADPLHAAFIQIISDVFAG